MEKIKSFNMNLLKILTIAAVMFPAVSSNAADRKLKDNESEVTFSVSVTCPNCEAKLMSELPYVKGVKDVKVDLENQTIWFLYRNDKLTKEEISDKLEKLGYPGKEIKSGNCHRESSDEE